MTEAAQTIANTAASATTDDPPSDAAGRRLLLVDDEPATRIALAFLMKKSGYDVEQAGDGQQAVSLATANPFDAIILDLNMPVLDGERTLQLLRRSTASAATPVIVFSQHADRERVLRCRKLGIHGYIVKQSLQIEKLLTTLSEVCRGTDAAATPTPPSQASRSDEAGGKADASQTPTTPESLEETFGFDQAGWKKRVETLGRVGRKEAAGMLAEPQLPLVCPSIAAEIRQALSQPEASLEEIAELIDQEPTLVARAIGMANDSSDRQTQARDIATASLWLGKTGIRELLDSAAQTPDDPELAPWLRLWWIHAMAVGQFAAALAPAMQVDPNEARAAGLVRDIGRLITLVSPMGDRARQCYDLSRNMAIGTAAAEQMLLGINHKQAGVDFCHKLGLPPRLAEVCQWHDPDDAATKRFDHTRARLWSTVAAANQIAKSSGLGGLPNDELSPLPPEVAEIIPRVDSALQATAAELQTLISWRLGPDAPDPQHGSIGLEGLLITIICPSPLAANASIVRRAMRHLGATVNVYDDWTALCRDQPMSDLIILDATTQSLAGSVNAMRRSADSTFLTDTPWLILARRSDDPKLTLAQAGIDRPIYPTPIRLATLAQVVRRLLNN